MLVCPTCNIDYEEGKKFCKHCGTRLIQKPAAPQAPEVRLPAWTCGISADGRSDGSFDSRDYPALSLSEALEILEKMPVSAATDPGEFCEPGLGFRGSLGGNICRTEDGDYYIVHTEEEPVRQAELRMDWGCSLEQVKRYVRQVYAVAAAQAGE